MGRIHRRFSRLIIGVLISCALPATAQAATYTVGTTSDMSSSACPSATETDCSLRQLILYVEAHPSAPDVIDVPAGTYTLNASYGQLPVTANLTILGSGAKTTTIAEPVPSDRSSAGSRVFDISAPSSGSAPTVALEAMTISGGDANSGNGYFGGDIVSSGTTTLSDDRVTNGFACSGGGVSNAGGTLTIERSLIDASQSACTSGGDDSGGVMNYGVPASSSTPDEPAHLTVDDSTIAQNAARLGAGIYSWNDATNTVTITNSTIADNIEQTEGGGTARGGGGGLGVATGTAQLQNTILAANTTTAGGAGPVTSNCVAAGALTSQGHNLEDANTCQLSGSGDLSNTNPDLGALADNGGPTETLALTSGSPALAQVPSAGCPATDQRGVARPTTGNCDIGAFELTPASTASAPTTSTPNTGSTPAPTSPAPSAPQTAFTVSATSPGQVALNASTSDAANASAYGWSVNGNRPIVCPFNEPQLNLASSAGLTTPVTLSVLDSNDDVISSVTKTLSISSRHARRRPAASATVALDGLCQGPISLPVPPLTPKRPAAPPRGASGGAPPSGCTDDLDFGAVDVHGCLAEVTNPNALPGGITAELGKAICSSTGQTVCIPSLVVGGGSSDVSERRSADASGGLSGDISRDLSAAGLASYYSYSA